MSRLITKKPLADEAETLNFTKTVSKKTTPKKAAKKIKKVKKSSKPSKFALKAASTLANGS